MTQREKRKCRNIRGEIIKDYTGWDFRINVAVRRGVEALTGFPDKSQGGVICEPATLLCDRASAFWRMLLCSPSNTNMADEAFTPGG